MQAAQYCSIGIDSVLLVIISFRGGKSNENIRETLEFATVSAVFLISMG